MERDALTEAWLSASEAGNISTVLDLKHYDSNVYRLGRLVITCVRLQDVGLVGAKEPLPQSDPASDAETSSVASELVSLGLPTAFGKKAQGKREPRRAEGSASRFAPKGLQRERGATERVRGAPASTGGDSDGKGGARSDSPWVQGYDTQWGCFYYYNNVTEESKWEVPDEGYVPWDDSAGAGATDQAEGQATAPCGSGATAAGAADSATGPATSGVRAPAVPVAAGAVAGAKGSGPRMLTEEDLLRSMGLLPHGREEGMGQQEHVAGEKAEAAAEGATHAMVAPAIPPSGGGGLLMGLLQRQQQAPQQQQQQRLVPAHALSEADLLARMGALGAPADGHGGAAAPMPPPPPAPLPPAPSPPPPLLRPAPPADAAPRGATVAAPASSPPPTPSAGPAAKPVMLTEEDILRSMGLLPPPPSGPQPEPAAATAPREQPHGHQQQQEELKSSLADAGADRTSAAPGPAGPQALELPPGFTNSPSPPLLPHHHPPPSLSFPHHGPVPQSHGPHPSYPNGHPVGHPHGGPILPPFPYDPMHGHPGVHPSHLPPGPYPLHHSYGPPFPLDPGAHQYAYPPNLPPQLHAHVAPLPPPGFHSPHLLPPPGHHYSGHQTPHGSLANGGHPPHPHAPGLPPPHAHPSGLVGEPLRPAPPPGWGPPASPGPGPTSSLHLPGGPPLSPPGFGPGPYPQFDGLPPPPGPHPGSAPPAFGGQLPQPMPRPGRAPPPGFGPAPPGPEPHAHAHSPHHHASHRGASKPPADWTLTPAPSMADTALAGDFGDGGGGGEEAGGRGSRGPKQQGGPSAAGGQRRAVTWTLAELERQLEIMAGSLDEHRGQQGHHRDREPGRQGQDASGGVQVGSGGGGAQAEKRGTGGQHDQHHHRHVQEHRVSAGSGSGGGVGDGRRQYHQHHHQEEGRRQRGDRGHRGGRQGGSQAGAGGGGPARRGSWTETEAAEEGQDDASFYDAFAGAGRGGSGREHREARGRMPLPGEDDGTRRVLLDPATAAYVRTLLPRNAAKYWMQRYSLFSRFDADIQLDTEGWWSVTPEVLAAHQALRCRALAHRPLVALDACCGCGGNVIQMAVAGGFKLVLGVEISPKRVEMARHNAEVYGVLPRCQFLCADFFMLAPDLQVDVLFMSPPWGGPKYQHVTTFDCFYPLVGFNASLLSLMDTALQCVRKQRGVVAAFLPRNTDLEQLASAVPEGAVWEVERAYVNNKLKGITLYAHPAIKQGQPNVRWEAEKEHATAAAAAAAAMEKQQGPGAGAGKGGPGAAGSVPEGDDRESAMAAVTAALAAL